MIPFNSSGLGFTVDLGVFDKMVGIQSTPAKIEIYDGRGGFWHSALGAFAAFTPGAFPILVTSAFSGYQLSKVEGGKPFAEISGAFWEFAIGMGLASFYLWWKGKKS